MRLNDLGAFFNHNFIYFSEAASIVKSTALSDNVAVESIKGFRFRKNDLSEESKYSSSCFKEYHASNFWERTIHVHFC